MSAKKNRVTIIVALLAVAVVHTACSPPGPRALLEGKRLLEAGKTDAAVQELQSAVSLLPTNAAAWNYLGLAYHRAGQWTNAAEAYSRAIKLDRDLLEARFNLGCLWLDENKLEPAKIEFTAYTLRRGNAIEGWLKLGATQLRLRETAGAEKSFREALRVNADDVEALNGLGLVQLQRNRPREAAESFADALKLQPDYRPALLNLATVSHQHLNDRTEALRRYRDYLALQPRAGDWEAVSAIVRSLEQPVVTQAQPRPQTNGVTNSVVAAAPTNQPKPLTVAVTRPAPAPKPESPKLESTTVVAKPTPAPVVVTPAPTSAPPPEVVKLAPEPVIKTAPEDSRAIVANSNLAARSTTSTTNNPPAPKTERRSLLSKLNPFRSGSKPASNSVASTGTVSSASAAPRPAPLPGRYAYVSPAPLPPGNRREAEFAFAQGQQAQRSDQQAEALQSFRRATQLDPAYFEAYYNLGLVAFNSRSFPVALTAWENAIALRPDNADARYNFALTLKAANYPWDAADELEKLLALHPDEARGHLTLGNLYADQLRDIPRARQQYNKVLRLDPSNPQAPAIRYWLVANPG